MRDFLISKDITHITSCRASIICTHTKNILIYTAALLQFTTILITGISVIKALHQPTLYITTITATTASKMVNRINQLFPLKTVAQSPRTRICKLFLQNECIKSNLRTRKLPNTQEPQWRLIQLTQRTSIWTQSQ
jgi:hypothetical protein